MSDLMRLSGINTGYDTEAMIEQLMASYQTKIDNQQKKLTKLSWQQEAYRDVTSKLTTFKDKYFDILNKSSYIMSPSTFNQFSSSVKGKNSGTDAAGLNVTTTTNSLEGNYKIKLDRLATATKAEGKSIVPEGFSLDLTKAAKSNYTTKTNETTGVTTRTYDFALDVKVGDVSKTIEFKFDVDETADADAFQLSFAKKCRNALNAKLTDAFGKTGNTDASTITGATNAEGEEYFLHAATTYGPHSMIFQVGGNAAVSISEKTGNFGLADKSKSIAVSMQSAVTGTNTVSVEAGGVTKDVSFEGVSENYYDSRDKSGNETIKAEYDRLKLAAYRKEHKLSSVAPVSAEQLEKFTYTSVQAAKDKNAEAFTSALNNAFKTEGVKFSYDGTYMTAKKNGTAEEFSMTSIEGGTLGIAKGNTGNKFSQKTKLEDLGAAPTDGKYTFEVNGKTVSLEKDATIGSLIDAVNKSGAGVTMTYSSLTNSFDVTSNDMGSGSKISITSNDFTKALGLTTASGDIIGYSEGENAVFEINGQQIYHNSNSYTIDGTTFKFTEDMDTEEVYNVSVSKSYDDVKKMIKDFVTDYNQLIKDVYDYTATAPKRDEKNRLYEPLTDAEKEELDEDEIEKMEKAAKQGILFNDPTISGIMSQIRSALYNTVTLDDGSKFGLFKMGIKTSTEYEDHGKLEIDEDAFNKAFEENPDAVTKLFTDSDAGIMKKVSNVLDNAVKTSGTVKGSLIRKAGLETGSTAKDNFLYRQMLQVTNRISQLQERYDSKEEYWWKVFTNLESAMGDFNNQSVYLSQYLGGGGTMM